MKPKPRYRITIEDRQAKTKRSFTAQALLQVQTSRILAGLYQGEDLMLNCRYVEPDRGARRFPLPALAEEVARG